jgi:hypothetical protein
LYAVGEVQYTKLLLEDIYGADNQFLKHNTHYSIVTPMAMLTKQMTNGKSNVKYVALKEAIKRRDADIYLRGSDGIDIAVGRTQSELEASVKQFTISILSSAILHIVVKVHRFKVKRSTSESFDTDDSASYDSNKGEALKFTGRYNATQFVRIRTTIAKAAVKKKPTAKKEKEEIVD